MDETVKFKKGKGLPFLLLKAAQAGKFIDGEPATTLKELIALKIIACGDQHAKKLVSGKYPITPGRGAYIRYILKISLEDWREVTEPVRIELKEGDKEIITGFLEKLRSNGLSSAVKFSPRHRADLDLSKFCVPARVVTEEEIASFRGSLTEREATLDAGAEEVLARRAAGVLLNGWLGRAHRRVVIQGEPGEGKTTALWHYAAQLCEECFKAHGQSKRKSGRADSRVPLILALNQVVSRTKNARSLLQQAIESTIAVAAPNNTTGQLAQKWLEHKAEAREVVLLLDGLDEMETGRIRWLRSQLSSLDDVPVILTTRYHADPRGVLPQHTLLRMVPFRWWIIDEFVLRYFDGTPGGTSLANELRRTLRLLPGLRLLAQNPFLLGVMCHIQGEGRLDAMPKTKTSLLEAALMSLLRRGDERRLDMMDERARMAIVGTEEQRVRPLRDNAKLDVLAEVAWHFQSARSRPMPELELLELLDRHLRCIRWDPLSDAHALLNEFVWDGVLVRNGTGPYNFLLRRFREYCLARKISRMAGPTGEYKEAFSGIVRGRAAAWGRRHEWGNIRPLNQPSWAEVWPLVAGCLKENPALIDALIAEQESAEDLLSSRLRLLAEALGEFLEVNSDLPMLMKMKQYEELVQKTTGAILELVTREPAITSRPNSWRSTLARLPSEVVVDQLVKRIAANLAGHGCDNYMLCLGEIGNLEARSRLIRIVSDPGAEEIWRANAAVGLGLIGDAESRDVLLSWLSESLTTGKKYLHYGCVKGLALVADERARRALARLMKSASDPDAQLQCIQECEHLFGAEIEGEMMLCAEGAAGFVRRHLAAGGSLSERNLSEYNVIIANCSSALGRIGGPNSAARLFKLLPFALSASAKTKICDAIAESGDDVSRRKLRELVLEQSTDRELSMLATLALVKVGDEMLLGNLLEVASSDDCREHLREAVAKACAESASSQAMDFLAGRLLNDKSPRVKLAAAKSIASRPSATARSILKQGFEMESSVEVHFECACGLALNGEASAVGFLAEILKNKEESQERRAAASNALGRVESETARVALREIYEDQSQDSGLKSRCKDSLEIMQRERGWRPMVGGGWEAS